MASPEAALIAALKANAGVAALVGTRVFLKGARQGEDYPYIAIQRIATAGAAFLTGPANLEWPLFQIEAWSPLALTTLTVAEAIRTAIDSIEVTAAGKTFTATFQDQRGPTADDETRNFSTAQDYLIWNGRS